MKTLSAKGSDFWSTQMCDCGNPACESLLEMVPHCHPKAALTARFYLATTLVLRCAECEHAVAYVAIAKDSREFTVDD